MRKRLLIILVLGLIITCLTACNNSNPSLDPHKPEESKEEFPELVVSEKDLLHLIGSPLSDAKTVFGVDYYAEQKGSYKGEEQTIYTYCFGDDVYATIFVRSIKGERIIYRVAISAENKERYINNTNVTLIGNINIEDITPEILDAYKDHFFPGTQCHFNMTTSTSKDVVSDLGAISSPEGTAYIKWNNKVSDKKIDNIEITSSKIVDVIEENKQFTDSSDNSSFPDLASFIQKTEDDVRKAFGVPGSNSNMYEGSGQLEYGSEKCHLFFMINKGKVESINYTSSKENDDLKIIDNITFGNNLIEIKRNISDDFTLENQSNNPSETIYCASGRGLQIILIWNDTYGHPNSETDGLTAIVIYRDR